MGIMATADPSPLPPPAALPAGADATLLILDDDGPLRIRLSRAMERRGVRRLVCVTGFGAGDSRRAVGCLQRVPFRLLLGRAYDDKDEQERLVRESGLDWTIVRPGILAPGPGFGRYRVLAAPAQWRNGLISRADVAHFIVQQLARTDYLRQAPVLVCA